MSDLKINNITDRTGDSGPNIVGVCTVSSGQFVVPVGPTEYRGGRGRAVFAGGYSASPVNYSDAMDYTEISTTGNTSDFNNLSVKRYNIAGLGDATRGVFAGGQGAPGTLYNTIDYVTISSQGGASDFGDLTVIVSIQSLASASDSTRGLFMGGQNPSITAGNNLNEQNIIQYITIATTGDSTDFGDLTHCTQAPAGCSSPTRALCAGGDNSAKINDIDSITIQTLGSAADFGSLSNDVLFPAGLSSTTRGVFAGGSTPTKINTIEYVTIASAGNATDFGDLTAGRYGAAGSSNKTRGLFGGGGTPTYVNTIYYITIASAGNATDYGDLTEVRATLGACSDTHGGLG